jgi:prophage regulatory protein
MFFSEYAFHECAARKPQEDNMSENKPVTVLNRKEVERRTTLARTTIYRKIKENTFPKQIRVSEKRVGWPETATA